MRLLIHFTGCSSHSIGRALIRYLYTVRIKYSEYVLGVPWITSNFIENPLSFQQKEKRFVVRPSKE